MHAAGLPLCPSPDPEPKGPKYWDSQLVHVLLLSGQPLTNLEIPTSELGPVSGRTAGCDPLLP